MRRVEIKEYQSGCGRNRNPNLPSRPWGLGFHRSIQFLSRVTSIVGTIFLRRPTMSAYHGRQSLALSVAPLAQAANDGRAREETSAESRPTHARVGFPAWEGYDFPLAMLQ